jgi:hypothetical protein
LLKVTPAQIKDAVNKYLNTENRVLLDIVPAGKGAKQNRSLAILESLESLGSQKNILRS